MQMQQSKKTMTVNLYVYGTGEFILVFKCEEQ